MTIRNSLNLWLPRHRSRSARPGFHILPTPWCILKNLIRSETFIFSMKTGKLHLVFNNIRNKTFEYEILLLTIIKYSKLISMRNNTSATCKVVQNVSPHVLSSLKSIKDSLKAKTTPLHYIYRYLLISHNRN